MATFYGIPGLNGSANSSGSAYLINLTGGSLAELADLIGDTFNLENGFNSIEAGLGNDIINGGSGADYFYKRELPLTSCAATQEPICSCTQTARLRPGM